MPVHNDVRHAGVNNSITVGTSDERAFRPFMCPNCGNNTHGVVAAFLQPHDSPQPTTRWAMCTACSIGVVFNMDIRGQLVMSPSAKTGSDVEGLPDAVAAAFNEARVNVGSGSYTSCELMCRKILMHVAVDKGASPGGTFASYLDHLESAGYVTPPMKPWVDVIRQNGNVATHELPETTFERANGTLELTTQLLRIIYEMASKAVRFSSKP